MADQTQSTGEVSSLDSTKVSLTGDQTVAGVKTFSSSPIVPTPTTSTQASNKSYTDDQSFINAIIFG